MCIKAAADDEKLHCTEFCSWEELEVCSWEELEVCSWEELEVCSWEELAGHATLTHLQAQPPYCAWPGE